MKNVLKIEKMKNSTMSLVNKSNQHKTGWIFVCALRHFILPAGKGDGRQCVSRGDTLYL